MLFKLQHNIHLTILKFEKIISHDRLDESIYKSFLFFKKLIFSF